MPPYDPTPIIDLINEDLRRLGSIRLEILEVIEARPHADNTHLIDAMKAIASEIVELEVKKVQAKAGANHVRRSGEWLSVPDP